MSLSTFQWAQEATWQDQVVAQNRQCRSGSKLCTDRTFEDSQVVVQNCKVQITNSYATKKLNMCIAVFLWRAHPLYPLILLLNRDEYHSR